MYPRNAASPERIAIGAVVQISDGAVQSSGVSITVRGQGGAEAAGGGTTAYGATGVIVYYTPTQAETDFTSFVVIASKTGCLPVCQTIITTASVTPGKVVLSGETHTSAVIPTVTTLTGHTAQTGDTYALANGASGFAALAGYLDTEIAAILADTNELQTDWANGGRLDLILDALASQTSVDDLPTNAELATALGTADDAVLAQVALVKAKTDLIPAAPAAVGDIPTALQNADALLNRDMSAVTDSTARSPLNALRFLRNKWALTGATLSVKKEDDTTEAWTSAVTTSAGADPISGSDPT